MVMTTSEIVERPPLSVPPNTTQEEDRYTRGQRKINLIWEVTQAIVTIMIIGAHITAVFVPVASQQAASALTNVMMVVVTFYYVRTNHKRTGGTEVVG